MEGGDVLWFRQLSLTRKFSLAVGFLLCFELVLLFLLDKALSDADRDLERAAIANNIAYDVAILQSSICDIFLAGFYTNWVRQSVTSDTSPTALKTAFYLRSVEMLLQDASIPASSRELLKDVDERMMHLLSLSVRTRAIAQELLAHGEKLQIIRAEGLCMMQNLDEISNRQILAVEHARNARSSRESIRRVIGLGAVSNIIVSLLLLAFFNSTIANRLFIIRRNTDLLLQRKKLLDPVGGSDEIATVDKAFHTMAVQLQELDQMKRQFFASISHDIRSPLNSINATVTALVESDDVNLKQAARTRLKTTARSCKRVVQIVTDLLDLEKIEQGKLELEIQPMQLSTVAEEAIDTLSGLLEQKGLLLRRELNEATVAGDSVWLTQVVTNLLSNAIKFSPAGAPLTVRTLLEADCARLEIADCGPGISCEDQERIFGWFKQTPGQRQSVGSSGLGLAIARRVIDMHDGRIGVVSAKGEGATFWFSVPLARAKVSESSHDRPLVAGSIVSTDAPTNSGCAPQSNESVPGSAEAEHKAREPYRRDRFNPCRWKLNTLNIGEKKFLALASLLTFELVQLFCLDGALGRAEEELRKSLLAKMMTIECCRLQTKLAEYCITEYSLSRGSAFSKPTRGFRVSDFTGAIRKLSHELPDSATYLQKLDSMERRIKIMLGPQSANAVNVVQSFAEFQTLREEGMQLVVASKTWRNSPDAGAKSASKLTSRQALQQAILTSALLNVLVVMLLVVAFNSEIVHRLGVIRRNEELLARRKPLLKPLTGNDEIAGLDRTFHEMAVQLAELETMKRQFFAAISHDIRSPLSSVHATLMVVTETGTFDLPAEAAQRLAVAARNCARIVQIVSDLLDIEKIEEGKLELQPEEFPLLAAVETATESLIGLSEEKGITITTQLQPLDVIGDFDWISRVITNLLANAIRFSPIGGRIVVKAFEQENAVVVEIIDEGSGIPGNQQSEIFEWFAQANGQTRSRGSSGLGLATARRIVEKHGGRIAVRSNLEQGATFWFSLPKEAAPSLSADRAEPIDESNEPIFEQTIIVSLKFMAVPVLPLIVMLAGITTVGNGNNGERKTLQIQALRSDATIMMKLTNNLPSIKLWEEAWRLEKSAVGNGAFPCSYYDCAKYYTRVDEPLRASQLLEEGLIYLKQYEQCNKPSPEQRETINRERLRALVLAGDAAMAAGNMQQAAKCYGEVFANMTRASVLYSASDWISLRLAGQGWLRCHRYPGKPLDNDRAYNSLPELIAKVATDQRRFVGAILDNGFIDKEEWSTFKQLKAKVEELDRVRGEKSINDYVTASKSEQKREARRLYFAGSLCRLIGEQQLARDYYMKSVAMLRVETAPNLVAIADALTFAGQAAAESDIRSALAIRRDAVACVGEILPAQLMVQTEVFGDFINSLIDNGKLSEAAPLLKERSKQFNRACLENRQSAAALWSVVQARIGVIHKNKPNDYKAQVPVYEEFLETMYKHAGAEEECTHALESLLRIYYTEGTLASADTERLQWCNKSINLCSRYNTDCHPLNPCDSKMCCQLMLAKATAVKQYIQKQYLLCAATCEAALKVGSPSVGSELRASLKEVEVRALKQQ